MSASAPAEEVSDTIFHIWRSVLHTFRRQAQWLNFSSNTSPLITLAWKQTGDSCFERRHRAPVSVVRLLVESKGNAFALLASGPRLSSTLLQTAYRRSLKHHAVEVVRLLLERKAELLVGDGD